MKRLKQKQKFRFLFSVDFESSTKVKPLWRNKDERETFAELKNNHKNRIN